MTREEVYNACITSTQKSNCLLLQAATGLGKSKLSIDIINHLVNTFYQGKQTSMLLLVAKKVHKQTWQDEINKWGGLNIDSITVECYESLKKHLHKRYTFILMDEVHHVKSDTRLDILKTLHYDYMLGLSATIPKTLRLHFIYQYHAQIVSCDIVEAIENDILPEPTILLFPLALDDTHATETWELYPKAKGPVYHCAYKDRWKYIKRKVHTIVSLTPKEKLIEFNKLILSEKNLVLRTRNKAIEFLWLHHCGQRLEWLATLKNDIVLQILQQLKNQRTITFCKTIQQAEYLGHNCIHSKNKDADTIYEKFNAKKIKHITAVNILNENANLVDCRYAIFANYSSSCVVGAQRIGRSLRHKSPVIIMPYYQGTREQEIITDVMLKDFNPDFIKTIKSVAELKNNQK